MKLVEKTKARIVLFYPLLWTPQWPMWAPLDLFYIATALLHAGYEVTIIDERVDPDPRDWLSKEIPGALFVGLSSKFGDQLRNALDAARFVKNVKADCPVVMGGWFPSLFPDQAMESHDVDIVVEGPGDFNIATVADRLLEGKDLEGLAGIWAKENGRIVKTRFERLPRLQDTHSVPWDLVNIKRYIHPHGWLNYYSSRGCPGGCTFCAIYCLDPSCWRPLSADRVVDEMDDLVNRVGARALKIMDTDFLGSVRRAESICRRLLERKIKVRFEGLGRYRNMKGMTDEQIGLLRAAGCTEIEMGIESGSQRLCDMIDKRVELDRVVEVARRFTERGIRLKVNFMFGIPSETGGELKRTFRLIHELKGLGKGIRLQLFRYTPLPDAPMNRQVWEGAQRGHEPKKSWSLQELTDLPINDAPAEMFWISSRQEKAVKRTFNFYAPLAYYDFISEWAKDRPLMQGYLKLFRPLARWRTLKGVYGFPFEMWIHGLLGRQLPRGEDDGVTPAHDTLPYDTLPQPPYMGDGIGPPD